MIGRYGVFAAAASLCLSAVLVWWFRSPPHYRSESVKRTSEPKPHENHKLASVP